jgi:hypothetical protein
MIIGLIALLVSILNSFFIVKNNKEEKIQEKELEEKIQDIKEEQKSIEEKLVPTKLSFKGDDRKAEYNFPIIFGTKGLQIVKLQKLLLKYDSNILPKYGADGYFDNELANALSKLIGRGFVESQEDIDKIENLIKNEK